MNAIASTLIALFIMCGIAAPANADPVNNNDPALYVSRIVPVDAGIRVTLSDGHRATLKPCRYEDGRRCYWNAEARGNGIGNSFLVARGTRFYLNLRGL